MIREYPTDVHDRGAHSSASSQKDETVTSVISQEPYVNTENSEPVTPPVTDAVTAARDGSVPPKAAESPAVTGVTGNSPTQTQDNPGAALLDAIAKGAQRHVIMSHSEAQMIALWAIHAHVIAIQGDKPAINHSPRLAITSPIHGCGKTTLCDYIARLTGSTILSNVSTAFVFRSVEQNGPVVVILDELDTFLA